MGKFACHCGYVISDSVYPCPWTGDLKWQPEFDEQDTAVFNSIKGFLLAVEGGKKDAWIKKYFNESYPLVDDATIISDIFSKERGKAGHCIYRCPEYERIYMQKEYFSNEWICYEKRSE